MCLQLRERVAKLRKSSHRFEGYAWDIYDSNSN